MRASKKTITRPAADESAEERLDRFFAMAQADGLRAHQHGPDAYRVHSISGTWYSVTWDEARTEWACHVTDTGALCKGFMYGGLCRHIACVEKRVKRAAARKSARALITVPVVAESAAQDEEMAERQIAEEFALAQREAAAAAVRSRAAKAFYDLYG